MSQGSSGISNGGGPDFHLPDEILSVIPTDPYEQLDLARKITSMAIASRVSKLESEMGRAREKLYEKDSVIYALEEKVSALNHACQEAESRLKIALDENVSWFLTASGSSIGNWDAIFSPENHVCSCIGTRLQGKWSRISEGAVHHHWLVVVISYTVRAFLL